MKPTDPIKDVQKQIVVLTKQVTKLAKELEALKPKPDLRTHDKLYKEAKKAVIEAGKASTSYIQRKLKVGYARSAQLMDMLEEQGVIGPVVHDGVRTVLKKR